jgi:hypothetical protein
MTLCTNLYTQEVYYDNPITSESCVRCDVASLGAITFNFDHMAYRIIAYFSIARGLFYNITI